MPLCGFYLSVENIKSMVEITLEPRLCECCGGNDLDPVWSNQRVVPRISDSYLFHVHVVVCRTCGFCFASPVSAPEALGRYYADSLAGYKGIALPYSIERRVSVLKKYSVPSGVFAEIGGDRPEEFHRQCKGLWSKFLNVEASDDVPAEYRDVSELPPGSVDVIAHYDVLEHVPNVRGFFHACYQALTNNGVMVCEVPDVRLYPRNLLLLEPEHVNHFSITSLASIAQQCGLRLIDSGHICSRSFGLLAVFQKDGLLLDQKPAYSSYEYLDTRACIQDGITQINRMLDHIKLLQDRIAELGKRKKKIVLWGVTDQLRRLLSDFSLPSTAIVVDSDPRRKDHLASEGVDVLLPKDHIAHIKESDLLVLFAPRYTQEIKEWILCEAGKNFSTSEIEVVGSGPSGESLL